MEKQLDMFGNEHIIEDVKEKGVAMQKKYGVLPQWKCCNCRYCFEILQQGKLKHICIVSRPRVGEKEDINPNDKACRKFVKQ